MHSGGGSRTLLDIGQDIEDWREKNKITKQELANALHLTEKTFRQVLTGTRELRSSEISILCAVMHKEADFFIPRGEDTCYLANAVSTHRVEQTAVENIKKKSLMYEGLERRVQSAMSRILNMKDLKKMAKVVKLVEDTADFAE